MLEARSRRGDGGAENGESGGGAGGEGGGEDGGGGDVGGGLPTLRSRTTDVSSEMCASAAESAPNERLDARLVMLEARWTGGDVDARAGESSCERAGGEGAGDKCEGDERGGCEGEGEGAGGEEMEG